MQEPENGLCNFIFIVGAVGGEGKIERWDGRGFGMGVFEAFTWVVLLKAIAFLVMTRCGCFNRIVEPDSFDGGDNIPNRAPPCHANRMTFTLGCDIAEA